MTVTHDIVAKLWNMCNMLKDDGVTYHQYVTELTYLLFLKMAEETEQEQQIPEGYRWRDLVTKPKGDILEHYKIMLIHLGSNGSRQVQQKNRSTGKEERVFRIKYYDQSGNRRHETIGNTSQYSAAQVNAIRAEKITGKRLPNTEKRRLDYETRIAEEGRWTFNKLWKEYQTFKGEYSTHKTDKGFFEKHLQKEIGSKMPEELIPLDTERLSRQLIKKKGLKPQTVRHILALINRLSKFGEDRGYCKGLSYAIKLPQLDNHKTEDLSPDQLADLLTAIEEDSNVVVGNLMKMALFTGLRKGELFKLQWSDVDFEKGFILIREPKGGKNQRIPLNQSARELLISHRNQTPYPESPFVFPGRAGNQRQDCKRELRRIRDRAGLPKDLRPLHGLRHLYASMLASSGKVDMYTLQKLLTHKSPQMTQRYAHLRDDALRRASDVASDLFDDVLKEKPDKVQKAVNYRSRK